MSPDAADFRHFLPIFIRFCFAISLIFDISLLLLILPLFYAAASSRAAARCRAARAETRALAPLLRYD